MLIGGALAVLHIQLDPLVDLGFLPLHLVDEAFQFLPPPELVVKAHYKARWLAEDPEALTFDNLHYIDIDIPAADHVAAKLTDFYAKYAYTPMAEPKDGVTTEASRLFEAFSCEFQALYVQLCPNDCVNTGKNRNPWKHVAIISHMKKLSNQFGRGHPEVAYTLNMTDDGLWKLERDGKANDGPCDA